MIFELFMFGTFWWWVITTIAIISILFFVEKEYAFSGSSGVFAAYLLFWLLFGNLTKLVPELSLSQMAFYASLYVMGGISWGTFRFYRKAQSHRNKYDDLKEDFLESYNITDKTVPDDLKDKWKSRLLDHHEFSTFGKLKLELKAKDHKSQISAWMAYWPLSVVSWLVSDLLRDVFEIVYRKIKDYLDAIGRRAMKGTEADF